MLWWLKHAFANRDEILGDGLARTVLWSVIEQEEFDILMALHGFKSQLAHSQAVDEFVFLLPRGMLQHSLPK